MRVYNQKKSKSIFLNVHLIHVNVFNIEITTYYYPNVNDGIYFKWKQINAAILSAVICGCRGRPISTILEYILMQCEQILYDITITIINLFIKYERKKQSSI